MILSDSHMHTIFSTDSDTPVEKMIEDGVDTFIEIGPGKTLTGFMRKINKDVKVMNIDKLADMDKVLEELGC